jgi:hypothetical protein
VVWEREKEKWDGQITEASNKINSNNSKKIREKKHTIEQLNPSKTAQQDVTDLALLPIDKLKNALAIRDASTILTFYCHLMCRAGSKAPYRGVAQHCMPYIRDNLSPSCFNKPTFDGIIQLFPQEQQSAMASNLLLPCIDEVSEPTTIGYLLEAGADSNFKFLNGDPVLLRAAQNNEPEVMELLIRHNALVNKTNNQHETPLHAAIKDGSFAAAEFLLNKHHPDLSKKNSAGQTPLDVAYAWSKNRHEKKKIHEIIDLIKSKETPVTTTLEEKALGN